MTQQRGRLGSQLVPRRADAARPSQDVGELEEDGGTGVRLRFADADDEARRRVLVMLLGVPAAELARLLALASRALDPRRDLAVFVVTTLDFAPLREAGVVFEYLPSPTALKARDRGAFDIYLRRRLAILRLKWDAAAEIDFGLPADVFVDRSFGNATAD